MRVSKYKCPHCGAVLYVATKEKEFSDGWWDAEYKCRSCNNRYEKRKAEQLLANPEDVKKERERHEAEVSLHEIKERQYKLFCEKYGEFLVRFLKEHVDLSGWDGQYSVYIKNYENE